MEVSMSKKKYTSQPHRPGVIREVAASELKNSWHLYLDRVSQAHEEVVITRYGKPVAKLVPYEAEEGERGIFGSLAGTVKVHGDIIEPTGEEWEADA
jgi:prevent-host-death family protein